MTDNPFMEAALAEAGAAAARGEIPVGAVAVDARPGGTGEIIARAGNRVEELNDFSAHAEILALREAARALGAPRIPDVDLYVTLEPCAMCAGAISWARVRRLYFGAYDPKSGGAEHGARVFDSPACHHRPEIIGGIEEARAADLLRAFFQDKR